MVRLSLLWERRLIARITISLLSFETKIVTMKGIQCQNWRYEVPYLLKGLADTKKAALRRGVWFISSVRAGTSSVSRGIGIRTRAR